MPRTSPYRIVLPEDERAVAWRPPRAGTRHRTGNLRKPGSCCTPAEGLGNDETAGRLDSPPGGVQVAQAVLLPAPGRAG